LLWGLQSSLNLQCSSDHGPGVGGEDAEEEHGELWGFPLTAPRVKHLSNYSFPLAELNRTLTPIAGYNAGVYNFTTIDISDKISMSHYYSGGVLGPDGKIVFVPNYGDKIGIFDPSDRSFTTIDTFSDKISGNYDYHGGVLGPDGKIVFVPYNADNVGIFDPSDRSFTTIDIMGGGNFEMKYNGGVLGPDGKIVFVPYNANNIGIFDPSDRSFTTIGASNMNDQYAGGVLGPDGKIVFVPFKADNVGIFDPSDRSFTTIDISDKISIDWKYHGGVLGPDGKIVFVPRMAQNIGVLEVGNQDLAYEVSGGIPEAWSALLSPHFNKY